MSHKSQSNMGTGVVRRGRGAGALPLLAWAGLCVGLSAPALSRADSRRPHLPDEVLDLIAELEEAAREERDAPSRARVTLPLEEADIFFEENATDGDLGIQFSLDGEDWKQVKIRSPDGKTFMDMKVKGALKKEIGWTGLFGESAEPSFDDLPREEFLAMFPPGEYTFEGKTLEGDRLEAFDVLTHDMPAPPVITNPSPAEVVDTTMPVTISWTAVADPNAPASVIEEYEIIVEKDEDKERLRVFFADMPGGATSVTVPAQFWEPGKNYKVEVIAVETSGNKTITEVAFSAAP